MARGDQLSRQWKIIHTLVASTFGKTVPDLADELGCTPRTVYRDLAALQSGGFPITTETRENRSYWRMLDTRRQIPLAFSIPELMALYFGKDMLKTYRGTVFYDAIESLLSKIKTTLAPEYINYLDRIRNRVDAGPAPRKDYTRFAHIIAELNRAIVDDKKIRIIYFSMGRQEENRRTVHPYRLRHVEDTLYLIGYCALRKGVRTFAVDRIKTVTVTDSGFHIPEEFDMQAFLQDSFGIYQGPPVTVKIRFLKSVAGYIRERIWHQSQHLSDLADGSLIFTATVAGIEEVSHWVLRWGAGAQVLAPDDLRKTISRHAAAMVAHYQNAPADEDLEQAAEILCRI
ncbi:MAG: transcriptional regulator [Desulfosarcina sp.]|nr:transcriptional regulator [Desulfosarcina sp.]MBC2741495.1 transcriptional regulator [Desulfosarcina sp.]MBC2764409.1 transcriptional regulator [Desulfosarcina sp.]